MAKDIPFKDWTRVTRQWLGQVSDRYKVESTREMRAMTTDLRNRVRKRITGGAVEGPSLSPKTIRLKGHDVKMIEDHEYADGLDVELSRAGASGRKIFASIVLDGPRSVEMALAQEFGSKKSKPPIPARPHWRPSLVELETSPRFRTFLKGRWFAIAVPL